MMRSFRHRAQRYLVAPAGRAVARRGFEELRRPVTGWSSLVQALARESGSLTSLDRATRSPWDNPPIRETIEMKVQRVARQISRGAFRIYREIRAPQSTRRGRPIAAPEPKQVEPSSNERSETATHFIEIEVIDQDGALLPGVSYEIMLTNGQLRRGTTDARGLARIDGIPAGECWVTLPEWDESLVSQP